MGSAISATSAERRNHQKARRHRHRKRKHRQQRLLQQLQNNEQEMIGDPGHTESQVVQQINDDEYILDSEHHQSEIYGVNRQQQYLELNNSELASSSNNKPFNVTQNSKNVNDENEELLKNGTENLSITSENTNRTHFNTVNNTTDILNNRSFQEKKENSQNMSDQNQSLAEKSQDTSPYSPTLSNVFETKPPSSPIFYERLDSKSSQASSSTYWDKYCDTPDRFLAESSRFNATEGNTGSFNGKIIKALGNTLLAGFDLDNEDPGTSNYIRNDTLDKEINNTRTFQAEDEQEIMKKLRRKEKDRSPLPPQKHFRKIGTFDVKIPDDKYDCKISGSAFISNGDLVLADAANKKLKLFNQDLEAISSAELDVKPVDLCCGKDDDLVHVSFTGSMQFGIQIFEVIKDVILLKTSIVMPWQPLAIARSNNGLAIIHTDRNSTVLQLTDLKGRKIKQFELRHDGRPLVNPVGISITENLQLLICDKPANTVYCFNTDGEVLFTYKKLREPMGICTDSRSTFITSAGIVHLVSTTGETISPLMMRQSIGFAATNVCYDKEDHLLLLTGQSNTMTAFVLKDML